MRHSALRLDIIYTSIRDKIITHCKDNKESGGLKCKVRRIFITCKMPISIRTEFLKFDPQKGVDTIKILD